MKIASSYYHPGEPILEGDYSIRYCDLTERQLWISSENTPF